MPLAVALANGHHANAGRGRHRALPIVDFALPAAAVARRQSAQTHLLHPSITPILEAEQIRKAEADAAEDPQKGATDATLKQLVRSFSMLRDSAFLLLGMSLLHIGSNVRAELADARIGKCALFSPPLLIATATMLALTFAMSIARYNLKTNQFAETALDLGLLALGSILQLVTKPAAFYASGNTATSALFCSIAEVEVGSTALIGFLCGEFLSFLSGARTLVSYYVKPLIGPGWLNVIVLLGVGAASFPLFDQAIAPALRDAAHEANFTLS